MAHWAELDTNNQVLRVLVVDNSITEVSSYLQNLGFSANWVQTSYNTRGGIHYGSDGKPDKNPQIGFNYAAEGYFWDGTGFYAPQPFPSWTLNKNTYFWEAPIPYPDGKKLYNWDESSKSWVGVS